MHYRAKQVSWAMCYKTLLTFYNKAAEASIWPTGSSGDSVVREVGAIQRNASLRHDFPERPRLGQ